jgi:hypothetical protein
MLSYCYVIPRSNVNPNLHSPVNTILHSCEQLFAHMEQMEMSCPVTSCAAMERFKLIENALASSNALLDTVNSLLDNGALDPYTPSLLLPCSAASCS